MSIPVTFIISGLGVGGAQMMLLKLLSRLDRELFIPRVICLADHTAVAEKFSRINVPVISIGMGYGLRGIGGFVRLIRQLKKDKPRIIQTWMYHADLFGGLGARIARRCPVVWNIRHAELDADVDKKSTIMIARMCARLSYSLPKYIVCCSETSTRAHEKIGYDPSKIIVIPNGFDLNDFRPDPVARYALRQELGIEEDTILIGYISRYHPQKDHGNFIRAAEILSRKGLKTEFLLCGQDIDWHNQDLVKRIEVAGLRGVFHLLGVRNDIPKVSSALDIATSASAGEGFSNTVGEAMACGIPCVVTDVGDSAMMVGETGRIVPPKNADEFSNALLELIEMGEGGRHELGRLARERVIENFAIDNIVDKYQSLYLRVLN